MGRVHEGECRTGVKKRVEERKKVVVKDKGVQWSPAIAHIYTTTAEVQTEVGIEVLKEKMENRRQTSEFQCERIVGMLTDLLFMPGHIQVGIVDLIQYVPVYLCVVILSDIRHY